MVNNISEDDKKEIDEQFEKGWKLNKSHFSK